MPSITFTLLDSKKTMYLFINTNTVGFVNVSYSLSLGKTLQMFYYILVDMIRPDVWVQS